MVVEDNEVNLRLFKEILRYGGYTVISAKDGVEGLEIAERERPDLVLMDVQLPGMDGITAMRKMRETPGLENTPIIALTAYAMTGDRERLLSAGFVDYIPKPVNVAGILKTVKKHLD